LSETGDIPLDQPIIGPVDGYVYLSGSLCRSWLIGERWTANGERLHNMIDKP